MEIKLKIILITVCRHWDSRTPMLEAQLRWVWFFIGKGSFITFWHSHNLKGSLRHHSNTLILTNSQLQRVTQTINLTTILRPSMAFSQFHNLKKSLRHHSQALHVILLISQFQRVTQTINLSQALRGILAISQPLRGGVVQDWDDLEAVWQHVYSRSSSFH